VTKRFFIGVGVQKCASTWLYDILWDHPGARVSSKKEMDFFSYHFGRGYQWYERHFAADFGDCLYGDISPSYFIDPAVPERLLQYAPEAKVLVSLRDPVERAVSNHRHEVRLGNFAGDDLSFEAGLANNPLYLDQSRYGKHLERWLEHVPRSRLLVVFQEDIDQRPHDVAREVYRFLELDPTHVSQAVETRSNVSHTYRNDGIEAVRRATRNAFRRLGVDGLWQAAQRAGMQRFYRSLNRQPPSAKIPPVPAATLAELRAQLVADVRLVEDITGRQLPHWRGEPALQTPARGPVQSLAKAASL
jgi:hypothetical protein